MRWLVHTPNLLKEMVENNPGGSALFQPVNIFRELLIKVSERAIELDDPQLNILMLRLQLYDGDPMKITEKIERQEARL